MPFEELQAALDRHEKLMSIVCTAVEEDNQNLEEEDEVAAEAAMDIHRLVVAVIKPIRAGHTTDSEQIKMTIASLETLLKPLGGYGPFMNWIECPCESS